MTQRAHLFHDVVRLRGAETFLEVLVLGHLAFRNVHEDVHNLKDVIDVCLYAAPPLLHFVLIACDLYGSENEKGAQMHTKTVPRNVFHPSSDGRWKHL